jgi:hypothetical protein
MKLRLLLTASLTFSLAGNVLAADPTADELVTRGLELRREAKPMQALQMFQKAHALAPSPRTLGQLGLVETSLEHWIDAEAHLTGSLATPNDAWVKKNRALLDQALGVSRGHIGELVVTGPDGTAVTVDGKPAGTLPAIQPVRLVEGNVVVTATGAGFKEFSKTVTIAGGSKTSLAIVLDPVERKPAIALSAPAPLAPPTPATSLTSAEAPRSGWKTPTGIGLIAAGAGLAAWGVTWIAIDGNDTCATGGPSCVTVRDTKTAGWVLTAAGAAAVAGGTVLLLTGRHRDGSGLAFGATPTSVSLSGRF